MAAAGPIEGTAIDAPHPSGGRRRFGNMLFSRWPVHAVFRHLLPWPSDRDVLSMQRCALEAAVMTPFGPLRVTTTHLEYSSSDCRRVDRHADSHMLGP